MKTVSSLYIHVPFCKHLCNYCDFYKQKFDDSMIQIDQFQQYLIKSWSAHQIFFDKNELSWSPLDTLYLGGGTPSLWGEEGAVFFKRFFSHKLNFLPQFEFTMEIDPGTWSEELINGWKANGLNRISIGTQSLNPDFLKILDRSHSLDETNSLLDFCSKNNWNFSLDFLLGVPFSKERKRDIISELKQLLTFSPKHISLYILNARSKYPFINQIPSDEYIREEYLAVSKYLASKGFLHYEVSNFALPGYESKHNLKYWFGENVAAFGPTGTGFVRLNHSQAIRYKWKVSNSIFEEEVLGKDELHLEEVYLALRTYRGWAPRNLTASLTEIFFRWEHQGYGKLHSGVMKLSPLGYLMLDSLMDDLFRSQSV
jgi:oxygen-independent coproporphyrinogen-3 oxidase